MRASERRGGCSPLPGLMETPAQEVVGLSITSCWSIEHHVVGPEASREGSAGKTSVLDNLKMLAYSHAVGPEAVCKACRE